MKIDIVEEIERKIFSSKRNLKELEKYFSLNDNKVNQNLIDSGKITLSSKKFKHIKRKS